MTALSTRQPWVDDGRATAVHHPSPEPGGRVDLITSAADSAPVIEAAGHPYHHRDRPDDHRWSAKRRIGPHTIRFGHRTRRTNIAGRTMGHTDTGATHLHHRNRRNSRRQQTRTLGECRSAVHADQRNRVGVWLRLRLRRAALGRTGLVGAVQWGVPAMTLAAAFLMADRPENVVLPLVEIQ